MFYPKNVPNVERALRILGGVLLVGLALFGEPILGTLSPVMVVGLILSALVMVVTGFVGWCPACAMVGRKIKSHYPHEQTR